MKEFCIGINVQIKLKPKPSVSIYNGNQVNVISMSRFFVKFLNYFPAICGWQCRAIMKKSQKQNRNGNLIC